MRSCKAQLYSISLPSLFSFPFARFISFEDEFECEKSKAEKNLLAVSKDKEKDSDGGRGESEPILPCKFSFTCNMGKSCNRRHPNTLAEPDKVLLMRLEDEAGRRLVPRWLRIKDKLMRAFGQSLREKKQKLGQVRELRGCI